MFYKTWLIPKNHIVVGYTQKTTQIYLLCNNDSINVSSSQFARISFAWN